MFVVFGGVGLVAYTVTVGLAFNLGALFRITPEQAAVGKWILLIIGVNVAVNFPFSVYGAVVNGFQRYDANSLVALCSSVLVAVVNVVVLWAGFGLVTLVACTTFVRVLTYSGLTANAYRISRAPRQSIAVHAQPTPRGHRFFSLRLDHRLGEQAELSARRDRDRRVMGSAPIAVWAVADRVAMAIQRLTNQLNGVSLQSSSTPTHCSAPTASKGTAGRNPPVAGHGGADLGCRHPARAAAHPRVGRAQYARGRAGHADSGAHRRHSCRQRERDHAAQGGGTRALSRHGEHRRWARRTFS